MKKAVIDLGTNTFHLLIVQATEVGFEEIFRKRIFVQLAEAGIERIGEAAFERGLNALRSYRDELQKHEVGEVKAFGTAALRRATNSAAFCEAIRKETGIEVEVIGGGEEARLITKGVRQAVPMDEKPVLVMDIGGGSVEFIIANRDEIFWAQSYPIGVAVLFNHFHKNDPISSEEITRLNDFLHKNIAPLCEALVDYKIDALVGASGTFDVLEAMLIEKKDSPTHAVLSVEDFYPIYHNIIKSNLEKRLSIKGLPTKRAQLIVVALILIHHVLEEINTQKIIVSKYAMKEGMLSEI